MYGSPGRGSVPPRRQRVVEHHPRAPERPRQRIALEAVRVQAVVVTKLHTTSIVDLMANTIDIYTDRHFLFELFGYSISPRIVSTCAVTTGRANRLWPGSYCAGSVGGAPVSVLRQYVEQQNRLG
jgi:hypothetical protein